MEYVHSKNWRRQPNTYAVHFLLAIKSWQFASYCNESLSTVKWCCTCSCAINLLVTHTFTIPSTSDHRSKYRFIHHIRN